jgi:heme-degrading monooxygenase HmoA
MLRHTVVFKLKHPKDSPEEKVFLAEIRKLSSIPGVKKFECLRQVSKKTNFDYGLSMEFDSHKAYDDYSNHPSHNAFVQKYWVTYVADFLEIDFQPFTEK